MMSKIRKPIGILSTAMFLMAVATIVNRILYVSYNQGIFLTLYITFLTTFYHFAMRILVGECITVMYRNKEFHYNSAWYKPHKGEEKFYRRIGVKKWKLKLITAKPEQFDIRERSYEELLHNMTQAEVGHEIMMALSFLPLLLIFPYGEPVVFFITSMVACMIDFLFVMIQRYNRPRMLKIKDRMQRN